MKLVKRKYAHDYNFAKMPKFIFNDVEYNYLKAEDILLYTLIVDRISLSNSNEGFEDEEGNLFAIMTIDEACLLLRLSDKSVRNSFKRLKEVGLIHIKRMGLQKPNRIFLVDNDYLNGKNYLSRVVDNTFHEPSILPPNNTDVNKTDNNKTNNIYTTLSSGGHFFYIYSIVYQRYMNQSHPDVTQELLDKLRYNLDTTIERLNVVEEDLSELIEYHFQNLSKNNNGHIQALLSNATDSPLYRYYNEIYNC